MIQNLRGSERVSRGFLEHAEGQTEGRLPRSSESVPSAVLWSCGGMEAAASALKAIKHPPAHSTSAGHRAARCGHEWSLLATDVCLSCNIFLRVLVSLNAESW